MKIVISFCLLFITCSIFSQTNSTAEDYILQLKNGAAVVRLYMNKSKTDLLTNSLNNPKLNNKERAEIQKALDRHLTEREAYKLRLIQYFDSLYNFSKVYFIADYDHERLMKGERKGFFINANGNVDESIVLNENYYLIFGRGDSDEKIIIKQPNGRPMPQGFPDSYNPNIYQAIKSIFNGIDRLGSDIKHINKKLFQFYENVRNGK